MSIALIHPQIAPNTGNIARLCVATGTHLHLVRPMGFVLSDRNLKRAAMDYWPRLRHTVHDDLDSFLAAVNPARLHLFSSKAAHSFWDARFSLSDILVFGNETQGLPASLTDRFASQLLRIPQAPDERCLNLSTAAGIAVYEAIRQCQ